eukprot:4218564-Prymnesium_polylepis.1
MPYIRKYCEVVSAGSIVVTHPPGHVAESLATVRHCSTPLDVSPTWSEYQDAYAPSHKMFTAHSGASPGRRGRSPTTVDPSDGSPSGCRRCRRRPFPRYCRW